MDLRKRLRLRPWDIAMQCIVISWLWLHRDLHLVRVRWWRRQLGPARDESEHSSETLSHNQTFDRPSHILTSLIFELDLQSAGSSPYLTYTRLCARALNCHLLGLGYSLFPFTIYHLPFPNSHFPGPSPKSQSQSLDNLFGWVSQGDHSEPLWVAHVIIVLAQGPNPSFSFLGDLYSTWGSVGTGAWTRTWTRAWQYNA